MKVIGITGGVGSGKSAVLDCLLEITNCVILRADDIAKTTILPEGQAYKPVVELLGKEILSEDGFINKTIMSSKIFSNRKLCDEVNSIIHPLTKELILEYIHEASDDGKDYAFVEAALLIESGYTDICDEVWYVFTPVEVRIKRLMDSRGYSFDKCMSIINNQLRDEEFRKNSDRVIDNSGTINEVRERLIKILENL